MHHAGHQAACAKCLAAERAAAGLCNPAFNYGDRPQPPLNNKLLSLWLAHNQPYWQASQSSSSKSQTKPFTEASISL